MSLRLKLLLLGLLTLVLPWGGCRYAREMESVLREGERQSLLAVAQTLASSLQGRNELLYRDDVVVGRPGPYDLLPMPLLGEPYIDGYAEDWPRNDAAWKRFTQGRDSLGILTGVHERMLYVLLDVKDDKLILDTPGAEPLESATFGDRVWLGYQDPLGAERQVFLTFVSGGTLRVQRIESGEYDQKTAVDETRIDGAWRATPRGYYVELRIPLSMLGSRLGVSVDDRDTRGDIPTSLGTLRADDLHTLGRIVVSSPALEPYLEQFLQPGLKLTVETPAGGVLAQADATGVPVDFGVERGLLSRFYRRVLDRPGERLRTEASAPIHDSTREQIIGTLRVSQTTDRWLTLRDQALTRLLNFTLLLSAVAVLAMFTFAAWLALRLSRLRRASESALTREGLVTTFPETAARDELGDVARSFSTLLGRLNEYTSYLRTLAGKLAHEIRTPLTIVRSSLENLESEGVSPEARVYLNRAREGSERLNAILIAMGAASRVEEAIQNAERLEFDLVPLLASAASSYATAFPTRKFDAQLSQQAVTVTGAPDLVMQALDKLIDNAVDFSPPGATIVVRLRLEERFAVLEVENPGPPLAAAMQGRLFESLWQSRAEADNRPHFGLGLYIVRLIAEFHHGHARGANLHNNSGVIFSVWLAR